MLNSCTVPCARPRCVCWSELWSDTPGWRNYPGWLWHTPLSQGHLEAHEITLTTSKTFSIWPVWPSRAHTQKSLNMFKDLLLKEAWLEIFRSLSSFVKLVTQSEQRLSLKRLLKRSSFIIPWLVKQQQRSWPFRKKIKNEFGCSIQYSKNSKL